MKNKACLAFLPEGTRFYSQGKHINVVLKQGSKLTYKLSNNYDTIAQCKNGQKVMMLFDSTQIVEVC